MRSSPDPTESVDVIFDVDNFAKLVGAGNWQNATDLHAKVYNGVTESFPLMKSSKLMAEKESQEDFF